MSKEKQNPDYKQRLKKYREVILNATTADEMHKETVELQCMLKGMQETSEGACLETIQHTLKEIKKFWLHDATRTDLARWIQTIISYL